MDAITIFYTDDDDDDLSIFADAVESLHKEIKLQTYTGGEKLLNAIYNPPPTPNVIFLDLNMPGKNGFDVLAELYNGDKLNIPIIIFSTSNEPGIIEKCRALGASLFITKPVLMNDIIKSIEHALQMDWENFVPTVNNFVFQNKD
ncbi:response regulator [Flavobacterium chungangense]|uniref:Response regulator n=1 Tax=Flavobacterium chungangense TaxID=554283 RepID=A0A6V6Z5I5_9FLAO|nr:response regulator [Flavobacterium chungangense]CAD0007067.1 response regulator [Flavobacterium chungangense]